jgi:hypothetical protein
MIRTYWVSSDPGSSGTSCLCVGKWEEEKIGTMMGDTYAPFDPLADQIEGGSAISTRFEGKVRKNNRELAMEIELLSVSGFDRFVF